MSREGRFLALAGAACAAVVSASAWLAAGLPGVVSGNTTANGDACRDYAEYGRHPGEKVRILSAAQGLEAERLGRAFLTFEHCTGIDVVREGRSDLEAELARRIAARTPPELVVLNQPGQIPAAAASGLLQPASAELTTRAIAAFPVSWLTYGTTRSQFYAPPLGVTVKSLVWYSPSEFRRHGWQVPQTWSQLRSLTAKVAERPDTRPWCEGLESGTSSGAPLTDWVEDVVLRLSGPDVYQQWIRHQVDFADPPIRSAFDEVSWFLRDPAHANGGFGAPASIATTPNVEAALPVLDGTCAMSRQPSTWANRWPAGTEIAEDGDVWAFPLPSVDGTSRPLRIGGEFLARFGRTDAAEMTQRFMISPTFTRLRAAEGGWVSPANDLRENWLPDAVDQANLRLLRDKRTAISFDASDAMPDAVGSGAFWSEGVEWVKGRSTASVVATIDSAWPR
ncbi:MAG: extracellular solute-binding protein [Kineosporiaceae bacterium]